MQLRFVRVSVLHLHFGAMPQNAFSHGGCIRGRDALELAADDAKAL